MENSEISIPRCYVPLRRLSSCELTRISVNPFYITSKCARCNKRVQYGPKCSQCYVHYHYGCAVLRGTCCEVDIIPRGSITKLCNKCHHVVEFGPQCTVCESRFHSSCVGPLDQCCQLNILERKVIGLCAKCADIVLFGPRCPYCGKVYHSGCVDNQLDCCGMRYENDDKAAYKCHWCFRVAGLGCPMCVLCGRLRHRYCYKKNKFCCGKPMTLEIYLIPSFKYTINYYNQFDRRRATLRRLEEMVVDHTHVLRSRNSQNNDPSSALRTQNTGCQTNVLDSITIVSVKSDEDEVVSIKSETDENEIEIEESPPLLEREVDLNNTPEPSSSSFSAADNDDSLKNLFDFLYNMVKKFPPQLQTQVKIDLFKTVTEADLKFKCHQ